MKYFIGVDGGGTKTEFTLYDENKNALATVLGPGSNHENYEEAFDKAAEIIWDGLTRLVEKMNIDIKDVSFTLMGLAGIDHSFQYDAMCEILRKKGLERFEIFNDGFIVVKAGSKSGAAIGLNCGTGTCCNAIDSKGKMLQLAGLGDFSGDVGNGQWIALKTFKTIYDQLYLFLDESLLTKLLFEKLNLKNREEFLGLLEKLESDEANELIMLLISIFFEAANAGDKVTLALVDEMALRGAQLIAAHCAQLDFDSDPVEVILSGSIHTKLPSDVYIERLIEKTKELAKREFDFIKLDKPPVYGCINWILQSYNK
ncbi:MAG: hypothetical protein GX345_01565 [Clostridiales bacterium]|nr:hypothetical protein [Clostridiales bacterium]